MRRNHVDVSDYSGYLGRPVSRRCADGRPLHQVYSLGASTDNRSTKHRQAAASAIAQTAQGAPDLGPGDFVQVESAGRHSALLTAVMLGTRVVPASKWLGLQRGLEPA
jgi:hypothetical protein